ncbi:MAG: NAD(P)H-binding protein [Desulfobacteraceae bacterium]|nr:NAD(P)H-binding protein [Desulfobacteraceae bacterium]
MRTALVIGATGLVGSCLVSRLLEDDRFGRVVIFTRRSSGLKHEKLEEHVVDFDSSEDYQAFVKGDILFSALGTTIKTAGSKAAQSLVDYTYQYRFARAARENGVPCHVLVSSAHASPKARSFYSRMKGELERDIRLLNFKQLHILQPSLLEGERPEKRAGERLGGILLHFLNRLGLFNRYRPVKGDIVAGAMINASFSSSASPRVYELDELFKLAGNMAG